MIFGRHDALDDISVFGFSSQYDLWISLRLRSFADMNVRGSSNTHSQFFSASQSLRRKRPVASDSTSPYLDSLGSAQSDEASIFDAIRVVTPTPDKQSLRFYASLNQASHVHERGLAVNLARFVPTDPQASFVVSDLPTQRQISGSNQGDHRKILSDQNWHAPRPRKPGPGPASLRAPRYLHRKAVSLGGTDNPRGPRWPGPAQPAIVLVQPRYPPPERSPTPPGLPSFGSPEAMRYSARFLMRDTGARARGNVGPDPQRSSYSEAIRRFFGLSTPTPRVDMRSVTGIGRAEDGTMVQGRFPVRQSGHGTNVVRSLHDHPFHHRFPHSRYEYTNAPRAFVETVRKRNPDRRPRSLEPHLSRRSSRTSGCSFSFPSNPTSAVVAGPRPPRPVAIHGLPRDLSAPVGLPRPSVYPEHSTPASQNAARSSVSSRMQSVFSAVSEDGVSDSHEDTSVYSTLVSWTKMQPCHCCLGEIEEPDDSLAIVASQDTYMTARSQVSPAGSQNGSVEESHTQTRGLQTWVRSVYSVMFPTLVNPATI
ncbi:unnamed protein product [Penicillium olsonii]|nr:unnamed protein product [Penicillium olsonii]CAG7929322.1 unnamed protein product [Penicillium olsonii]